MKAIIYLMCMLFIGNVYAVDNNDQVQVNYNVSSDITSPEEISSIVPEDISSIVSEDISSTIDVSIVSSQELIDRLTILESQITEINKRISLIESNFENGKNTKFFNQLFQQVTFLYNRLGYGILFFATILIILFILINKIISWNKEFKIKNNVTEGDQDNLIDGQDQDDCVATKLNLARAYIEMGNDDKAEYMLYEVLSQGDDSERYEADVLLKKIKTKKLNV
ncbi:MAG: hypothetical protein LBL40_00820 [Coxiellaceae bacterium]|jgi:FimV-like protein|nr:hypothetical protein [Coxiellaceae bacterium]